jgi:arabinose-5-phosphate isomerase
LPVVAQNATLREAVVEMSSKGMGMTAVIDGNRHVAGVFTDGDLRRCLDRISDINAVTISDVMTRTPRTITADRLAIDCVDLMETAPKVTVLLVTDSEGRLTGALHLHDLFRARVV